MNINIRKHTVWTRGWLCLALFHMTVLSYGQVTLDSSYLESLYQRAQEATYAADYEMESILLDSVIVVASELPHWDYFLEISNFKASRTYRAGDHVEAWKMMDTLVQMVEADSSKFSPWYRKDLYSAASNLYQSAPEIWKGYLEKSYSIFLNEYEEDQYFEEDSFMIAQTYAHNSGRLYMAYGLPDRAEIHASNADQILELGYKRSRINEFNYRFRKMITNLLLQDIYYKQGKLDLVKKSLDEIDIHLPIFSQYASEPSLEQAHHKQWVRYYLAIENFPMAFEHINKRDEVLLSYFQKTNFEWVESQADRLRYYQAIGNMEVSSSTAQMIVDAVAGKDLTVHKLIPTVDKVLTYYTQTAQYNKGLELLSRIGIEGDFDNEEQSFDVTNQSNVFFISSMAEFYASYGREMGEIRYLEYAHSLYQRFFTHTINLAKYKNIIQIISEWKDVGDIAHAAIEVCAALFQSSNNAHYIKDLFNITQFVKSYELNQYLNINDDSDYKYSKDYQDRTSPITKAICQLTSEGVMSDSSAVSLQHLSLELDRQLEYFVTNNPNYKGVTNYNLSLPGDYIDSFVSKYQDATILNYYAVDDRYYITIAKDGDWSLFIIPNENLTNEVRGLIELIEAYGDLEKCKQLSKKIYGRLITPIAASLSPLNIIIADEGLSRLPFEVLQDSDGDFLITKHAFSFAESYLHLRSTESDYSENRLLSVAPGFILEDDNIIALQASLEEAKEIHDIIPGIILLEANATKSGIMRDAQINNIVHIASHAESDIDNPLRSSILLSKETNGTSNSSMLYTHELLKLDLSMKLVSLNACNTAKGAFKKGRGLQSLAQSFNIAGARATLGTQWNAVDKSGKYILSQFYYNLKNGQTKPESLRKAKLSYIDSNKKTPELQHPYYWASYALYGDVSPIVKKEVWWPYVLIALLFIPLLLLFRYKFWQPNFL